jgi:hypothetical protein
MSGRERVGVRAPVNPPPLALRPAPPHSEFDHENQQCGQEESQDEAFRPVLPVFRTQEPDQPQAEQPEPRIP